MHKAVATALTLCSMSLSSFALFVNGGFEDGNLNGWNVQYGTYYGGDANPYDNVQWGTVAYDQPKATVVDNTFTMTGLTTDINPYVGDKMALLNDYYGNDHATRIWQDDVITQTDIDNGSKLYVDWGVVLEDPNHGIGSDPFFGVNVTIDGVVKTYYADSDAHNIAGSGWTVAGKNYSNYYYKADQWEFDLSSLDVGDNVKVELFVADCAWGGHGAFAFLDGIGTVKTQNPSDPNPLPPSTSDVPEPCLLTLLGLGLLSMCGLSIRKRK